MIFVNQEAARLQPGRVSRQQLSPREGDTKKKENENRIERKTEKGLVPVLGGNHRLTSFFVGSSSQIVKSLYLDTLLVLLCFWSPPSALSASSPLGFSFSRLTTCDPRFIHLNLDSESAKTASTPA